MQTEIHGHPNTSRLWLACIIIWKKRNAITEQPYLYDKWTGVYSNSVHLSIPPAAADANGDELPTNSAKPPSVESMSLDLSSSCVMYHRNNNIPVNYGNWASSMHRQLQCDFPRTFFPQINFAVHKFSLY